MKLECEAHGEEAILKMDLGLGQRGYARPEEILVNGFGLDERKVASLLFRRNGLFILKDGEILTPMDVV